MKYSEMDWGTMEAVVNKLGGMEGVKKLLRGGLIVKPTVEEFKVWHTVKIGTGPKTANDFRKALRNTVRKIIDDWANDILHNFKISEIEEELDLVKISVAELGFGKGSYYSAIMQRAKDCGLELCSVEAVLQLCLQCKDLPKEIESCVRVAMEAYPLLSCGYLSQTDCALELVTLGEDYLDLGTYTASPNTSYVDNAQFIFVRPK